MNREHEYRILERRGLFYVQVKEVSMSGFWPFRKRVEEWRRANVYGTALGYVLFMNISIPMLNGFNSLEEAREQISLFLSKDKIHSYEQINKNTP